MPRGSAGRGRPWLEAIDERMDATMEHLVDPAPLPLPDQPVRETPR